MSPTLQSRIFEMCPELSFAMLGGAPMCANKRTTEGRAERIWALPLEFGNVTALVADPPPGATPDDVLDAIVGAWTAHRHSGGCPRPIGGRTGRERPPHGSDRLTRDPAGRSVGSSRAPRGVSATMAFTSTWHAPHAARRWSRCSDDDQVRGTCVIPRPGKRRAGPSQVAKGLGERRHFGEHLAIVVPTPAQRIHDVVLRRVAHQVGMAPPVVEPGQPGPEILGIVTRPCDEPPTDDFAQSEGLRKRGRDSDHRQAHMFACQANDEIGHLDHAGLDPAGHVGTQVDAEGAALLHQRTRGADICAHGTRRAHRNVVSLRVTEMLDQQQCG